VLDSYAAAIPYVCAAPRYPHTGCRRVPPGTGDEYL
jgi:hypothetical protein